MAVAVFVVRFDVTQGNVVAHIFPPDALPAGALDGLEFKAIPSGLHALKRDRVFLKQGALFGLACFDNMKTADASQRNARMCSVGVLSRSHGALYALADALEAEAAQQNLDAENGAARDFSRIDALHAAAAAAGPPPAVVPAVPAAMPSSFASFVRFLGPSIFTVWKAVLLRKRVLVFSPVPIEQGCQRVRWVQKMAAAEAADGEDRPLLAPADMLWYVNVWCATLEHSRAARRRRTQGRDKLQGSTAHPLPALALPSRCAVSTAAPQRRCVCPQGHRPAGRYPCIHRVHLRAHLRREASALRCLRRRSEPDHQ